MLCANKLLSLRPLSRKHVSRPFGINMPRGARPCSLARGVIESSVSHSANAISQLAESHSAYVIAQLAESHSANVIVQLADASAAVDAATDTSSGSNPFDLLADVFETILKAMDGVLESAHVPYSYGFSIIILTVAVKALTFPLSKKQVQSTVAMQALQPSVKELQAKYADDKETLQLETSRLYKEAGVNPLAGCLPTLATIPVFIGLYRALSNAAAHGLLEEDFFWIPSLAGPTTLAANQAGSGMSWLFPLANGVPPIGWAQAGAYLILPVLLVVSQYVSQKIMQPDQNGTEQAGSSNLAILKFLPLMIGWFSLNVPSGLTLYWFVNNILSTAQQVYLKSSTVVNIPTAKVPEVKAIPVVKAKVETKRGKELSARKRRAEVAANPALAATAVEAQAPPMKDSRGKGDKFRSRKSRDAASLAASQVVAAAPPNAAPAVAAAGEKKLPLVEPVAMEEKR